MSYVLVIDDNRSTAEALVQMLKFMDFNARSVLSPSAAMVVLTENVPKVVCLDINMPGVDGFEVLAYLRREPRLANVPVFIITSDDQPETEIRALQGGASAVIIKPVMPDILEDAFRKAGLF
ncbi:MAG: response regulator [Chloroflexota bacterium]